MEQRILKYKNHSYVLVGYTKGSDLLQYMQEFLENLSLERAQAGAQNFRLGQINDFIIDYGNKKDDTFYVAFWNLIDSKPYEIKVGNNQVLDDRKIPKLKLSFHNFDDIFKKWIDIKLTSPQYLIISQNNSGWVELDTPEQLTIEQEALVQQYTQEKKRQAQEKFKKNRSIN